MKSKQPKKEKAGKRGGRPQATRLEKQGDVYRRKVKGVEAKAPENVVCKECKAVRRNGRWRWPTVANPGGRSRTLCPACTRIRDRYPAGEVRIAGEFAREHRDEILARVHHLEEREKRARPLHRLMEVGRDGDVTVVTTTDARLAHAIGKALQDAFKGKLEAPWVEEGGLLRVTWTR